MTSVRARPRRPLPVVEWQHSRQPLWLRATEDEVTPLHPPLPPDVEALVGRLEYIRARILATPAAAQRPDTGPRTRREIAGTPA